MDRSETFRYIGRSLEARFKGRYFNLSTGVFILKSYTKKIDDSYNLTASKEGDRELLKIIFDGIDPIIDVLKTQDLHVAISFIRGYNYFPFIKGYHTRTKENFLSIASEALVYLNEKKSIPGSKNIEEIKKEHDMYNMFPKFKHILFNLVHCYGEMLYQLLKNKGICEAKKMVLCI